MRVIFPTLILCAIFLSVPARAASFDCAKARSPDERAVCASRALSEMDVEMAVRYETLAGLVAMGTRGDMGDEQKTFLSQRHQCGANRDCLTALYQARIVRLKSEYQGLKSRGPF
jgi:uncharacterized protein